MPPEPSGVEPSASTHVRYDQTLVDSRGRKRADLGLEHQAPGDDEAWHPEEQYLPPDLLREKHQRQRAEQAARRVTPLPPAEPIYEDGDRADHGYFGGPSNAA